MTSTPQQPASNSTPTKRTAKRKPGPTRAPLRDVLTGAPIDPTDPKVVVIRRSWYGPTRGDARRTPRPSTQPVAPVATDTPPPLRGLRTTIAYERQRRANKAETDFVRLSDAVTTLNEQTSEPHNDA